MKQIDKSYIQDKTDIFKLPEFILSYLNHQHQNPPLQQDLNRVRYISQNQNTLEINRQIIHPRQNRNFQTPGVHFIIPQSPTSKPLDFSSSTLPETPPIASQRSTLNIPSDCLGSTPTSEQIRESLFNPPVTTERLSYWATHCYTRGEQNLIN